MVTIKNGDFIELNYTGKLVDGTVFDTTIKEVATTAGLPQNAKYKTAIICVGEGHLLPGLDKQLEGQQLGKRSCVLTAEEAFGKKDAKLLKLIPLAKFKESKIQPMQGLEVNIDGHYGVVRTVSGGRVTVDFNHPLAGKDIIYDVDVLRVVENPEEKAKALLDMIGMHYHGLTMEGERHLVIKLHSALPQPMADAVNKMVTKKTGITTVTYHVEPGSHENGNEQHGERRQHEH